MGKRKKSGKKVASEEPSHNGKQKRQRQNKDEKNWKPVEIELKRFRTMDFSNLMGFEEIDGDEYMASTATPVVATPVVDNNSSLAKTTKSEKGTKNKAKTTNTTQKKKASTRNAKKKAKKAAEAVIGARHEDVGANKAEAVIGADEDAGADPKKKRKSKKMTRKMRKQRQQKNKAKKALKTQGMEAKQDDKPVNEEETEWDYHDIHPLVLKAIKEDLCFERPTPIQRECLLPAIRDWKDIVAAAETGSGKTLAFGIPIVHRLQTLFEQDRLPIAVAALVISPTRELAMQITTHMKALAKHTNIKVAAIVGGMAPVKQSRLLAQKPHVVVATPGRLWELINDGDEHLNSLADGHLRFFVLDEADRMVAKGHFQELHQLLEFINRTNEDDIIDEARVEEKRKEREGKGKERWLRVERKDGEGDKVDEEKNENEEKDENEGSVLIQEKDEEGSDDDDENEISELARTLQSGKNNKQTVTVRKRKKQILLFSATLMLSQDGRLEIGKKNKSRFLNDVPIIDILGERVGLDANPHICDLTTETQTASGLVEQSVECMYEDKDIYLYYFLLKHKGKAIIFANSISSVKRLQGVLGLLKIPVYALHAQMQQRQRLKNLDRFKTLDHAVVVATDVAARGLDIPAVPYVVQYQIPRSSEVYIHRAGRTARAGSTGLSLSIVDPQDSASFQRICRVLNKPKHGMDPFHVEQAAMNGLRRCVTLAQKLDVIAHRSKKEASIKDWFEKNAEAAGIELDADNLARIKKTRKGKGVGAGDDEDDPDNGGVSRQTKQEAGKAAVMRGELKQLLNEPKQLAKYWEAR